MSLFITFEGTEGSGKSTQARRLHERLHALGYRVIVTKEPGGTRIGDLIRRLLLDFQYGEMAPATEILLFAAARAQHVSELIRPVLRSGGIVVCDRFADSTYAYQGYGLGRDLGELRAITQTATGGLQPDLTIYLDLPPREGLERKRAMAGGASPLAPPNEADQHPAGAAAEWNRLDAREITFHDRVREGYHALIAAEPGRWLCFDGHLDRDTLASTIWHEVEPRVLPLAELQGV